MNGSWGWHVRLEVFGVMRAGVKGEFRDRVVGKGPTFNGMKNDSYEGLVPLTLRLVLCAIFSLEQLSFE